MLSKITMPGAGQTTDSMTIARWLKAVGDLVARGDALFEVETDKATLPVESFAKGKLLRILVPEGDKASVGDVVAYVGEEGDLESLADNKPPAAQKAAEDDDYVPVMASPPTAPASRSAAAAAAPARQPAGGDFVASPAAKKAARDAGVPLADVFRSSGRSPVRKADVLGFSPAAGGSDDFTLLPLTPMRKIIAARMLESVRAAPTYTVEVEIDMTALVALRARLKARGVQSSYHDFLAKCAAAAVPEHPLVNASWTDSGIRIHHRVNVGIAVSVEGGLIVPVVPDVGNRPLAAVSRDSSALIAKARAGKLKADEMSGGTITISNLGGFPVSRFTAILNPPESCILAVGATTDRPCREAGELAFRPIAVVVATFDHRVVDGAYGAGFLADFKAFAEDPALMLCLGRD